MVKSSNIPIANRKDSSFEEAEKYQETIVADYKDYIFYSRVLNGMQKKQNETKTIAHRYQNQALINHVIYTRHFATLSRMPHPSSQSQGRLISTVEDSMLLMDLCNDNEDEMIFELDI